LPDVAHRCKVDSLSVHVSSTLFAKCSVIAAAVLGNASAFEMVMRPEEAQFQSLYKGEMDVLHSRIGVTMKQDVYEVRFSTCDYLPLGSETALKSARSDLARRAQDKVLLTLYLIYTLG
jgi:hypothetical protein